MEPLARMKRGAVDLDGVVAQTYAAFIREAQERYDVGVKLSHQFENYDLSIGTDITHAMMDDIFNSADFYRDLPVMPWAKRGLQMLKGDGNNLHVITARPSNQHVVSDTLHWLALNRLPLDSVHLVSHSSASRGADEKLSIAKGLDLGWAVEDSPTNARAYAQVCKIVFLQNASYNQNEKMPGNVIRVNDLRAVAEYLRETNK